MESNPLEANLAWESKVARVMLYNMSAIKNYADLCYHNKFFRDWGILIIATKQSKLFARAGDA